MAVISGAAKAQFITGGYILNGGTNLFRFKF
jgi:hypothetical protein